MRNYYDTWPCIIGLIYLALTLSDSGPHHTILGTGFALGYSNAVAPSAVNR